MAHLPKLADLFAAEPDRLSRLSFEVAGLYFDWSKTHLDKAFIDTFISRAERRLKYMLLRLAS